MSDRTMKISEERQKAMKQVRVNEIQKWKEEMAETRKILLEEKRKQREEIQKQEQQRYEARVSCKNFLFITYS